MGIPLEPSYTSIPEKPFVSTSYGQEDWLSLRSWPIIQSPLVAQGFERIYDAGNRKRTEQWSSAVGPTRLTRGI
jgi:hypothetical protein